MKNKAIGNDTSPGSAGQLTGVEDKIDIIDGYNDIPTADSSTNILMRDVIGNKTDTSAGDSIVSLLKKEGGGLDHVPKFGGIIYFVSLDGNDSNDGLDPVTPLLTIGAAIVKLTVGDAINVMAGTYTETGLNLNVNACEIWFEIGAILAPVSGTPLTISAHYCKVICREGALRVNPVASGTGVLISGNWAYVHNVRVPCGSSANIGFDITGDGCVLNDCRASAPLVSAFKIQGDKIKLNQCCTGGEIADTSIGYWVTNSCDKARFVECGSQGNSTAGFQFDAGCTNIVAKDCDSGGGDGHFIDNAEYTYLGITDKDSREFHEHTYPTPDGEGTAGDPIEVHSQVSDETGDDSTVNFFGNPHVIVPVSTITTDWFFKGANVFATTAVDIQRFFCYRVEFDISATRNSGNDWDEGATELTVQDATEASQFQVNDLVWIASPNYKPDGEIVKITDITNAVITIERQTENSGRTGLHWDHTTNDDGNEEMYLCWRDENKYHFTAFDYSASGARDMSSFRWVNERRMHANDGLIIRMINGTDDADSRCDVSIIWSD